MNVTMLPLGSISPSVNTGKNGLKTGNTNNAFSSLLQLQASKGNQDGIGSTENLADVLKTILQILKNGLPNTNGLGFTNNDKISDDQISNLLGMTKEDWKAQMNDLLDSLQSLFANLPQFLSQLKEVKSSLVDGKFLKGMSELASAVSKLPSDAFEQLKGNQLQTFAKNVKVTEQLAKTVDLSMGDIKQLTQLNEGLQNVIAKIELLVRNSKLTTQNTILQTAFSSILKDRQSMVSDINQVNEVSKGSGENIEDSSAQTNLFSNLMNPISKTEQFILHLGKGTETSGNYSEFVKEFTNILAKSQLTTGLDGTNKLFIKLYPEHLGSIRIELLQDKGSITAKMFASSGTAKDLLDSQINQLKDAFSMQNIQVDKIDVLYGETQTQKFGQQDPRQQSSGQNNETPNQENEEENDTSFSNFLSESLLEKII
ncbi:MULTISPECIES: flagellar hook-length control protein FliK [Heyndrickxia]|uniref:flagellar hook-length control protein FliK n=1 Tax=Heyndrickxia TaxID=2837504 RepID=UPI0006EBEAF4|nr:flagellar hook-length control protein FliK [Heyndrickxia shackletonii]NEY98277.1 flagellar hook-length control protein FliK [Heyndrickxia shackletonii]